VAAAVADGEEVAPLGPLGDWAAVVVVVLFAHAASSRPATATVPRILRIDCSSPTRNG